MPTINGKACVANGRNLLTGTSSVLKTKQLNNGWNVNAQATNGSYQIKVVKGQTYTYRAWLDNTNGPDTAFVNIRLLPTTEGAHDYAISGAIGILKGETGYSILVFTPQEDGYIKLIPYAYNLAATTLVRWKEEKLEKGSVATPWSPAPVDKVFSDGKLVYGRNLLLGTSGPFVMGYGIPNTTWDTTNQVSGISLPVTTMQYTEVLPQGTGFPYTWMPGVTYTQSIYISTDAPLTGTPIRFTWFTAQYGHDTRGSDNLVKVSTNVYRATSTYTWPSSNSPSNGRNADLRNLAAVFDFTKGTFLQFYKPKLEQGNKATDWSLAPEDVM